MKMNPSSSQSKARIVPIKNPGSPYQAKIKQIKKEPLKKNEDYHYEQDKFEDEKEDGIMAESKPRKVSPTPSNNSPYS